MALIFNTDIIGKPFFDSIKEELEKRRVDKLDFENIPIWRRPYVKMTRMKEPITTEAGEVIYTPSDAQTPFRILSSTTNQVNIEDIVNRKNGSFRSPPVIKSLSSNHKDFSFYEIKIEFEIPDIVDFKDFRNTWLSWGADVEIEWGRAKSVTVSEDKDGIYKDAHRQKMHGKIVFFDYKLMGNRKIGGTFTIYSTGMFLALKETKNRESNFFSLFGKIFKDELLEYLKPNYNKPKLDFEGTINGKNVITFSNDDNIIQKAITYATVDVGSFAYNETIAKSYYKFLPYKEIKPIEITSGNINIKNITDFLLSNLKISDTTFPNNSYVYINLISILKICNKTLEGVLNDKTLTAFDRENITTQKAFSENIQKYGKLEHDIVSNDKIAYGSFDPSTVLINPWDYKTPLNVGEHIFISIEHLNRLIQNEMNSKRYTNVFSFVGDILQLVKESTGDLIDLKWRVVQTDSTEFSIHNDSEQITNDIPNTFHTFKLYDINDKIKNIDISTDLQSDMANVIFFGGGKNSGGVVDTISSLLMNTKKATEVKTRDGKKNNFLNTINERDYKGQLTTKLKDLIGSFQNSFSDKYRGILKGDVNKYIRLFSYIPFYYKIQTKYIKSTLTDRNRSRIKIPLNLSMTVDGVANVYPGQVFQVDYTSFPIDWTIGDASETIAKNSYFIIKDVSDTIQNNSWNTSWSAILYVSPQALKANQSPNVDDPNDPFNDNTIKNIINEIVSKAYQDAIKD